MNIFHHHSTPKEKFLQIYGWIGMVLILVAYFLVSFSFISAQSITYQVLNIIGSFGIVLETASKKDWQPTVLNVIFLLIAIGAILRIAL